MRISLFSQYFPPDVGGASTRVSNIVAALERNGHDVTVVTAFPHYPQGYIPRRYRGKAFSVESYGKTKIIRVWIPSKPHTGIANRFILYVAFTLSSLIGIPFCKRTQVAWAISPNYLCMIPAVACRIFTGSKVVHDVVDVWPDAVKATGYSFPSFLLKAVSVLARLSYLFSNVIATISDTMASTLRKLAPENVPIVTMENCVPREFFEVPPKKCGNEWKVMYLGTLNHSNDFETVLDAARIIRSRRQVQFSIVGSGELSGWIQTSISDNELSNVTLVAGKVEHKNVPDWLAAADALLLPLRNGFGNVSFPIKLGEYLASARPVICTVDGQLANLMKAKRIGLSITPGDPSALANGVETLLADSELCEELGARGREYAQEHFSMDSFTEKIDKMLAFISTNNGSTPILEAGSKN